ncbi:sigma 54-interacting transcriptional regulator [Candidatus Binatia bacterium]|nr:sigma 54-interacting transcriptional regulator [Candidatus Binatia bacterium]
MTGSAESPADLLRARLKWYLFVRVVLVSVLLGALALVYLQQGSERYAVSVQLLLFAIVASYGITVVSAVFLAHLRRVAPFAYLQVLLDVGLTTGVIFVTGGPDSPFGFLYSLPVIGAAGLLSTPGAVVAASLSSMSYAALVGALNGGLMTRPAYPIPPAPPDLHFAIRFATTNATFFVIAALAGSLVRRLHTAEQLLHEQAAAHDRLTRLHEALARNLGSALITTDVDGLVTSVNQAAEDLVGAGGATVVGQDIGTLFPALRHTPGGRLQFLQSTAGVQPIELAYRGAQSGERALRCSAVALRDTYHNPIGGLYIVQDITTLRRLEARLAGDRNEEEPAEEVAAETPAVDGLIGTSPAMGQVRDMIERVARSDATVLITGESGTGKELVARAIHARGTRAARPFVAVNCGAIPAELVESELFGHAKGAFTGAVAPRSGLFRAADGGTIFLDEIGDLQLALQVKLLRVLQERSFVPVGTDTPVVVDVRVIAATNRCLVDEVAAERFRQDLFYRLNVLAIEVPPLRERRQDIPPLVRRFLRQFSELQGKRIHRLSVAAAKRLQEYEYPGNIRELENIVEHAVALCDGETIHEEHLPAYFTARGGAAVGVPRGPAVVATPPAKEVVGPRRDAPAWPGANLDDDLAEYEKSVLLRALAEAGGVKKRAARLLGINYRSFRHRLQKYGLGDPGAVFERHS